jgi:hypothetical protein
LFKSPGVRETLLRRSSFGGSNTHVKPIMEAQNENSHSSQEFSGIGIKHDTSGGSMKMMFKGVDVSGVKKREKS